MTAGLYPPRTRSVNFVIDHGERELDCGLDTPGARDCFRSRLRYARDEHVAAALLADRWCGWQRDILADDLRERLAAKVPTAGKVVQ